MWVKYMGKPDMIIVEFNGKRYAFRKVDKRFGGGRTVMDIPLHVFQFIQNPGNLYKNDMVPCEAPGKLKPELQTEPVPEPMPKQKTTTRKPKVKKRGRKSRKQ